MSPSRILIVDDTYANVELVKAVLGASDFELESALNAAEALAKIAHFRPDLILMDIQMPDMDGLELSRRLREDPATQKTVIIAFTAYAMKGDEEKMRTGGCDGYIAKPINVATFADEVRRFLRQAS